MKKSKKRPMPVDLPQRISTPGAQKIVDLRQRIFDSAGNLLDPIARAILKRIADKALEELLRAGIRVHQMAGGSTWSRRPEAKGPVAAPPAAGEPEAPPAAAAADSSEEEGEASGGISFGAGAALSAEEFEEEVKKLRHHGIEHVS